MPSLQSVSGSKASVTPERFSEKVEVHSPSNVVLLQTILAQDCDGRDNIFNTKRTSLSGPGVATAIQGAAILKCYFRTVMTCTW